MAMTRIPAARLAATPGFESSMTSSFPGPGPELGGAQKNVRGGLAPRDLGIGDDGAEKRARFARRRMSSTMGRWSRTRPGIPRRQLLNEAGQAGEYGSLAPDQFQQVGSLHRGQLFDRLPGFVFRNGTIESCWSDRPT